MNQISTTGPIPWPARITFTAHEEDNRVVCDDCGEVADPLSAIVCADCQDDICDNCFEHHACELYPQEEENEMGQTYGDLRKAMADTSETTTLDKYEFGKLSPWHKLKVGFMPFGQHLLEMAHVAESLGLGDPPRQEVRNALSAYEKFKLAGGRRVDLGKQSEQMFDNAKKPMVMLTADFNHRLEVAHEAFTHSLVDEADAKSALYRAIYDLGKVWLKGTV